MNTNKIILPILIMISFFASSCAAVGGIFKAGMWSGVIIVILIVAIVIYIISKLFSRNKNV